MTKIIAVANQKGGVGKTTTAVNLGACLAAAEKYTLLVDLDPQANATSGLGLAAKDGDKNAYHVLLGDATIEEVARQTELKFLKVVPSHRDLIGAEVELIGEIGREKRLADAIDEYRQPLDYVLVDCPPSLGLLTLNALTAAASVLIPVQTEYYALEGIGSLMHTIERVRHYLNPTLEVEGVLLTMADFRTNLSRQVAEELRSHFGEKVYQTTVFRNVRLSESPSHGKPILLYDIASRGSKNYLSFAEEFLAKQAGEINPT